jgi:pyruvate/2-oxoglutarate/acetoin dehydrogenase E1 component
LLPLNGGMDELELQPINQQDTISQDPERSEIPCPLYRITVKGAPDPTLTLAAYGYMAELARKAMLKLAYETEIFTELYIPTDLKAFNLNFTTSRLLVIEEGTLTLGWGAEIISRAVEASGSRLKIARRLAARDLPVPASGSLEVQVLPGVDDIIQAARTAVESSR